MITEQTTITKYVEVTNRNNGQTGYTLNDGRRVQFSPGETKKISLEELQALSYMQGGEFLLKNYFIIKDTNALDYFYTEEQVKYLLSSEGTLDQLEDCLNFAPDGVLDLIKDIAVKTALPDTKKRKLIFEKTGFNVDNAIRVNEVVDAGSEDIEEEASKVTRKTAPLTTAETSSRKTAPVSKYNVTSVQE
jgi:hypothetical protein